MTVAYRRDPWSWLKSPAMALAAILLFFHTEGVTGSIPVASTIFSVKSQQLTETKSSANGGFSAIVCVCGAVVGQSTRKVLARDVTTPPEMR